MKFEKKLIILSGRNIAKGTMTLERNAYGTFASLNVYNLPDLNSGEYAVGLKSGEIIFTRKLGSMGRILSRFSIDGIELAEVHCIVYETAVESPVMYGTNGKKRLWEGNMMDGIRSKKPEFLTTGKSEDPVAALPEYSPREENVENFFLDILPKDSVAYADTAVASVNYYPNEMNIEVTYSKRDDNADFTNPVDRAAKKALPWRTESGQKEPARINAAPDSVPGGAAEHPVQDDDAVTKHDIKEQADETAHKNIKRKAEPAPQTAEDAVKCPDGDCVNPEINGEEVASCVSGQPDVKTEPSVYISGINENLQAANVPPLSDGGFVGVKNMELIFYEQIKEQLDALFNTNPRFEALEKMLPETKWAKIDYDHTGKYYVVGLVGAKPDYICYGVPARYTPEPPGELSGYCQWLPLDETKPEGEGFWLMFQDAVSGESVPAISDGQ